MVTVSYRLALPLLALALVAGCTASKEMRVRTALTDAGVPEPMAQCMAEPLARDLSTSQLQSLGRVAKVGRTEFGNLTQKQLLDLLKRDLDPETVGVVMRAGLGCVLRG